MAATSASSLHGLSSSSSSSTTPNNEEETAASSSQSRTISPSKKTDLPLATPLMNKGIVTAIQLKETLRAALDKVVTAKKDSAAAGTPTTSQSDQLSAYRQRHIQNRQTVTPSTTQKPAAEGSNQTAVPNTSTSTNVTRNIHDYISVVNPRGQMAAKLVAAAPYNFFLTTITSSKPTHSEPLSITFQGKVFAMR